MRVSIRSPFDTFHIPIVLSLDPDAKYSPFGEYITLFILSKWPLRVFISFPVDTLHKPITPYIDPDAKNYPFGEKITL